MMTEAFNWLEVSAELSDADAWQLTLDTLNLTAEDDARLLPLSTAAAGAMPTGSLSSGAASLLRSVFDDVRLRRASDWRVQQVFEELITTVRAEDPTLAAEEAKKARLHEAYEGNRAVWLVKLLGRAKQLGLPVPPPRNISATDVSSSTSAAASTRVSALVAESEGRGGSSGVNAAEVVAAYEEAAKGPLQEVDDWGASLEDAAVREAMVNELGVLMAKKSQALVVRSAAQEAGPGELGKHEQSKHAHYARLLKLPRLIDETLASWIDPSEDLSDKQIFHELLRMMGLPESIESRLMRAMIEAVKQHRLRREREAVLHGDWADQIEPEELHHRAVMRHARVRSPAAAALVNVGGDGNEFAIFMGAMLRAIGAKVRLTNGCAKHATVEEGGGWSSSSPSLICQLLLEVRLGRQPVRIVSWARSWLAGSKWVSKTYHYRVDHEGYAWLNLDYSDTRRIQRPGVPYKRFDTQTLYYPDSLTWEVEGEDVDSTGAPRLATSPVQSLDLGGR